MLESIFSTFYLMNSGVLRLNYRLLLVTSTPVTVLFALVWRMFYNLPAVILPCPLRPNDPGRDVRLTPETYDCCIALGVLAVGGVVLYV